MWLNGEQNLKSNVRIYLESGGNMGWKGDSNKSSRVNKCVGSAKHEIKQFKHNSQKSSNFSSSVIWRSNFKVLEFWIYFFLRIDVNSKTFKILIQAREGNKYQLSSFYHSVLLEKLKFGYVLNTWLKILHGEKVNYMVIVLSAYLSVLF